MPDPKDNTPADPKEEISPPVDTATPNIGDSKENIGEQPALADGAEQATKTATNAIDPTYKDAESQLLKEFNDLTELVQGTNNEITDRLSSGVSKTYSSLKDGAKKLFSGDDVDLPELDSTESQSLGNESVGLPGSDEDNQLQADSGVQLPGGSEPELSSLTGGQTQASASPQGMSQALEQFGAAGAPEAGVAASPEAAAAVSPEVIAAGATLAT